MTTPPPLATWLRARTPAPPDALAARLESLTAGHEASAPSAQALLEAAETGMRALLRDGCLTRSCALDLLAIDALVTYAFEAAADDPDDIDVRAADALRTIAALAEPYRA